jgi:hypothetical protein
MYLHYTKGHFASVMCVKTGAYLCKSHGDLFYAVFAVVALCSPYLYIYFCALGLLCAPACVLCLVLTIVPCLEVRPIVVESSSPLHE